MHLTPPPAPSAAPPLSLDWTTQKSKEDALTLVAHAALRRYFGPKVRVVELTSREAQKQGDFRVELPDGSACFIECKFEDYPDTWFPEVLQYVVRAAPNGEVARRLEEGWVYKTTAHLLLYVSPVTGLAVLAPRKQVLDIQMAFLQAVLLSSRTLEVPQLLNAALNKHGDGIDRAGIGLGLLRDMVLLRFVAQHGTQGLHVMDYRPELTRLQETFRPTTAGLKNWAETKVLSEDLALPLVPGLTWTQAALDGSPSPLHVLGRLGLSDQPISNDGFRFFQAAGEQCVTGQPGLARHAAGTYTKRAGTFSAGNGTQVVRAPVPSTDFAPGARGRGSVKSLQRRLGANFAGMLNVLEKEGLGDRRREYLLAVRACTRAVQAPASP